VSPRVSAVRVGTATLPLPAPLRLGAMEITEREYAAVEVETEDGLVGKAYCLTRNAPVAACVERLVAPVVAGREADPEPLWEECSRATVAIGRTGLVVRAIGLVDIALWDIAAQAAGVPLWRHLGGADPAVPVMMVAAYPLADRSPESLAEDVIRYGAAGYTLLKVARDADRSRMRRLLETAAAGLPGSARLVVDVAYGWRSSAEALAELADWGDTPLAWLEDPLVPEDAEGCAAIRREGAHPIGVGDEVTHIATFRALLDANALDVLRLDVPALGGVTPARRVQALAAERGVRVSLHVYPEVSVHLAALQPGAVVETFDPELPGGNPLDPAHTFCDGGPAVRDGVAVAPEAAGLGFELDWERFRTAVTDARSPRGRAGTRRE
jgi:L-alanine-DL-glutamate epimerase-like enolase superfamily enzyme